MGFDPTLARFSVLTTAITSGLPHAGKPFSPANSPWSNTILVISATALSGGAIGWADQHEAQQARS